MSQSRMSVAGQSQFRKHRSPRILPNQVRETPSIPVRRVRKDVLFDQGHAVLPSPASKSYFRCSSRSKSRRCKDRKFQSLPGAFHCDFCSLNEVTSRHSVSVTLAKGTEQDKAVRAEGVHGGRHRYGVALPKKRHRGDERERPKLRLRRSAGVGLGLFQMIQDFSNDFLFGDEGDNAEGAPTFTFQRVG